MSLSKKAKKQAGTSDWQPGETAPKDNLPFIADIGYPWPVWAVWDSYDERFCIVNLASCPMEGDGTEGELINTYFETDTEQTVKRWMPAPKL
jgi:hypothetical protein